MRIALVILICFFSITKTISQGTYFNNLYNYNDFSPALAVIQNQGDYIFSGVTYDSINNSLSKYLASIDTIGNLVYWKTISDTSQSYWAGYVGSLVSLGAKGCVAAGHVNYGYRANAILYRYNIWGDTLWTKEYPDMVLNMRTQFWDCDATNYEGYIMIGYHPIEAHHTNVFLVKADSLGNEQWRKEYGEQGLISHGYSVVQTPDKGYLLGCYRYVAGNDDSGDPYVIKVDSLGNFEWERNLGGPYRDFFTQVCIGNDGSYIAGTSLSDSTGSVLHYSRIKIVKISTENEIVWEKYYTKTDIDNKLYSIYPDHDGGYIATGHRNDFYSPPGYWTISYGWLLKIDEFGDSIWYREYQYYSGTDDVFNNLYDVSFAQDGGYAMVGQAFTWGTPQVAWVIKVDSLGCDTPGCATGVGIENPPSPVPRTPYLQIFPNPAGNAIYFKYQLSNISYQLSIYDLFGRKQDEIIIPPDQEQTRIDISSYPAGVYVAVLKSGDAAVARGKFVKH